MSEAPDQQNDSQNNEETSPFNSNSNLDQPNNTDDIQTNSPVNTIKEPSSPNMQTSMQSDYSNESYQSNKSPEIQPISSTPVPTAFEDQNTRTIRSTRKTRTKPRNQILPDNLPSNFPIPPAIPPMLPSNPSIGMPGYPIMNPMSIPNYNTIPTIGKMKLPMSKTIKTMPRPMIIPSCNYYSNIPGTVPMQTPYAEPPKHQYEMLNGIKKESIELLFELFDLNFSSLTSLQSKNELFSAFINSKLSSVGLPNLVNSLLSLIDQIDNHSSIYQQLISPRIPIVYEQSPDHQIIYKFAPLYKSFFEIPLNAKIKSEYSILAMIVPPNPNLSQLMINVNGNQISPQTFGESTDVNYYLIYSSANDSTQTINVQLNPNHTTQFCFAMFFYVVPASISKIENFSHIDTPIKGVRTDGCFGKCLFNFYDVIKKIYQYGYSICPHCKKTIILNKLHTIPIQMKYQYIDNLSSNIIPHNDSMFTCCYDYFDREIRNYQPITQNDDENDEKLDSNKYIEDLEKQINSIFNHP